MAEADTPDDSTMNIVATAPAGAAGEDTNSRCYLLELPRELRDIIIQKTLTFYSYCPATATKPGTHGLDVRPYLAFTSKQLRAETLPLFYGKYTFCIRGLNQENNRQLTRAKLWLKAIEPHLHRIKKVKLSLCDDHRVVLELCAAAGKKVTYRVGHEDGDAREANEDCSAVVDAEEKAAELRSLCDSVGDGGFGSEEYIRAVELFLFPESTRCEGYHYSELGFGSDVEWEGDEYRGAEDYDWSDDGEDESNDGGGDYDEDEGEDGYEDD